MDLSSSGLESNVGCCEHGKEDLCSITAGIFLTS
jgi:hypothetical protein